MYNYGNGNPSAEVPNGTNTDYVLYSLVWDATANNADLFVNGAELISDIPAGTDGGTEQVRFGDGSGNIEVGETFWKGFSFVIPEPTSLGLLGLGGLALFARRRR